MVVHFANALEYEGALMTSNDVPLSKIDYEYLEKSGLTERLSVWKEINA